MNPQTEGIRRIAAESDRLLRLREREEDAEDVAAARAALEEAAAAGSKPLHVLKAELGLPDAPEETV